MAGEIQRLERLVEARKTRFPFVEANAVSAKAAINGIDQFLRKEVTEKITDIERGMYLWRRAQNDPRLRPTS